MIGMSNMSGKEEGGRMNSGMAMVRISPRNGRRFKALTDGCGTASACHRPKRTALRPPASAGRPANVRNGSLARDAQAQCLRPWNLANIFDHFSEAVTFPADARPHRPTMSSRTTPP